jgi:putative ABC transport system permease protein
MRESFRQLLTSSGFELRLAPRGTLPFDTEATIRGAAAIEAQLGRDPDIIGISPVLGGQLHVVRGDSALSLAALGTRAELQGDYEVVQGQAPIRDDEVIASRAALDALGLGIGDTLSAAGAYDPQLRTLRGTRTLRISGVARFLYLPVEQRAVSLPVATLQAMGGEDRADRVSLFMVRLRPGAEPDSVRARIDATIPQVGAVSVADAIQQVDQRLSYFRQLAFILGAVSLIVGFLLVTTIVTVSVNERIGEIAVLRAIGVTRIRIVRRIALEGLGIMLAGGAAGMLLGLVTARYLNSILSAFPGLPAEVDFFLFKPADAWTALGLLVLAGILAGIYPSWRAASLPIAVTLREEAVG